MTKEDEVQLTVLDAVAIVGLETRNEALEFECTMLEREVRRLVRINRLMEATNHSMEAANHSMETALARVQGERDDLRSYVSAIKHSRAWRILQVLRGWVGRRWP